MTANRPRSRVRSVLSLARDPLSTTEALFREVGDVVRLETPVGPLWLLNHPDHVHQVLVRDQASFRKDVYTRRLRDLLGDGLLTSEGEVWRRNRRLAQPAFQPVAIRGYGARMVALAEDVVGRWGPRRELDLHAEMMRLTLRIATDTLFGADLGADVDTVGRALDAYMHAYLGVMGSGWRLPAFVPTPDNLRRRRAIRDVREVVGRLVRERRDDAGRDTLLGMLLAATEDGRGFDERQLADEATTLLMAGHETTAGALTFALYLLSQHPEVEERLRAEVDALDGAPVLERLPYTALVAKETLRLYPPAWAVGREAVAPVVLEGGHRVPVGGQIWINQLTVQRDARWFPEPLAFRPERWTPAMEKALPKGAYFPFGAGPRICIGKRFAELELVLVLATIVRRSSLRLAPGETLSLMPSVTLRPRDGLRMIATERAVARRQVA